MKKCISIIAAVLTVILITGFSSVRACSCSNAKHKKTSVAVKKDTLLPKEPQLNLYKKNVSATYYANKFNGRKTSSGERFDNTLYTAAHMDLPFGTKVRVTNEANGKFVDVKINDRGPYSRAHEIDLTRKAFMEIASNKNAGSFKVKIEIIEEE